MKYKTLAQLKAAYESGELSKDCPLILDNDLSLVWDDATDEQVYSGPGYEIREEALDLCGIPWDHC